MKPRAVRENERSCSSSGSPSRPTLLSSQIAFYGRCRSILSTSATKANVDPAEKAHERRNEKAAQNAPVITSPVFTGPKMTLPLIYHEIPIDLEEPGSFGFLSWLEMTLRWILRVFVLAPAKSQAGIKANSVKGDTIRKLRRILSRSDWWHSRPVKSPSLLRNNEILIYYNEIGLARGFCRSKLNSQAHLLSFRAKSGPAKQQEREVGELVAFSALFAEK